jgi:hypothetical protein
MKQQLQAAGMLLSLLTLAFLLSGCSGGSGGLTAALEGDALPPGVPVSADVSLGTNQQAVILLQREGGSVSGVMEVGAPPPTLKTQTLGVMIPPQRYTFSGTISGQRHFEARGSFPGSLGTFILSGDLPTTQRGGVMTASTDVDGDGVPEVVTTTPPSFPVLSRAGAAANLQITGTSNFNGLTSAITVAQGLYSNHGTTGIDAYLLATNGSTSPRRIVRVGIASPASLAAGQSFDASNTGQTVLVVAYVEIIPGNGTHPTIRRWISTQGTVNIQTLSGQDVALQLNNLVLGADGTAGSQATGTFTLNGTFTLHGSSGGVYVG